MGEKDLWKSAHEELGAVTARQGSQVRSFRPIKDEKSDRWTRQSSESPLKSIISEELGKRQVFRALPSFNQGRGLKLSPDTPKCPLGQR